MRFLSDRLHFRRPEAALLERAIMIDAFRLKWEPEGATNFDTTTQQVSKYMDGEAIFAQFAAGSCLMLKPDMDIDATVRGAMREARSIADFKVYPMKEGDYLVFFASALLVHVGADEFRQLKVEIVERGRELLFPGESFLQGPERKEDFLVGIYARGKLQRDAWSTGEFLVTYPSR